MLNLPLIVLLVLSTIFVAISDLINLTVAKNKSGDFYLKDGLTLIITIVIEPLFIFNSLMKNIGNQNMAYAGIGLVFLIGIQMIVKAVKHDKFEVVNPILLLFTHIYLIYLLVQQLGLSRFL